MFIQMYISVYVCIWLARQIDATVLERGQIFASGMKQLQRQTFL